VTSVPNVPGKAQFASVYTPQTFLAGIRSNGWDPGVVPRGVIFTYGGMDLLCAAQREQFTMNPMLGPGPGRFFTVNETDGAVGVCCMGIGAPAVVAQMEVLIALGVAHFLSIGTAGGLGPDQSIGDVVVLTGAIRDEGVSYHYLAPGLDAGPDPDLTAELANTLTAADIAHTSGWSWTTDAPYRQSAEEIVEYRTRGVRTVEMEAASVFAVGRARQIPIASAVVLDGVFGDPIGAPVMDTATAFGRLYDVFKAGIAVLGEMS
jgi:nucleoside phosphorylase